MPRTSSCTRTCSQARVKRGPRQLPHSTSPIGRTKAASIGRSGTRSGHYLGPDRSRRNRDLEIALQEESGTLEEMKADLVSAFLARSPGHRGTTTSAS